MLMECPDAREYIVQLLGSPVHDIQWECLELLRMYSQMPRGRDLLINNLDLYRYVFIFTLARANKGGHVRLDELKWIKKIKVNTQNFFLISN